MMFTINISICTIFGSLLEITYSNEDIKILTINSFSLIPQHYNLTLFISS